MGKVEALKRDMETMRSLESLTSMLEQTAARTIAQMRSSILDSRLFFSEVWRIYGILKQLQPPPPNVVHKHLVVCIGIDWGMPGSLLNRVSDTAKTIQAQNEADLLIAGKMLRNRFKSHDDHTVHFFSAPKKATLEDIQPIYKVVAMYARVTIVYPSFESLSKQNIVTASFSVDYGNNNAETQSTSKQSSIKSEISASRFILDPNAQELADYLNEAIVGLTMHHYFAEATLAYSAAQMVAMRNSHDNAQQEGKNLFVRYNRARRELIDSKIRELYGSKGSRDKIPTSKKGSQNKEDVSSGYRDDRSN